MTFIEVERPAPDAAVGVGTRREVQPQQDLHELDAEPVGRAARASNTPRKPSRSCPQTGSWRPWRAGAAGSTAAREEGAPSACSRFSRTITTVGRVRPWAGGTTLLASSPCRGLAVFAALLCALFATGCGNRLEDPVTRGRDRGSVPGRRRAQVPDPDLPVHEPERHRGSRLPDRPARGRRGGAEGRRDVLRRVHPRLELHERDDHAGQRLPDRRTRRRTCTGRSRSTRRSTRSPTRRTR